MGTCPTFSLLSCYSFKNLRLITFIFSHLVRVDEPRGRSPSAGGAAPAPCLLLLLPAVQISLNPYLMNIMLLVSVGLHCRCHKPFESILRWPHFYMHCRVSFKVRSLSLVWSLVGVASPTHNCYFHLLVPQPVEGTCPCYPHACQWSLPLG